MHTAPHDALGERGSHGSLDDIGPASVLRDTIEHRRRAATLPAALELEDGDAVATQRRDRLDPGDDVFQKIR